MADKSKLRGSHGSLSDTLTLRFDPGFPAQVANRWLGSIAFAATISRRTTAWNKLPAASSTFDALIVDLDSATHSIVVASDTTSRIAALDQADAAMSAENRKLDNA